jgi:hypothetical protein
MIGSMSRPIPTRVLRSAALAVLAATCITAPVFADALVELQPGTGGCNGVLPSNDGNTDMRVVGGSMTPGGTAVFEITYPVNPSNVGKEFTILDCAYINDVATLKYIVSFVPSHQSFVLQITLAVPDNAPVGGMYCNYVKTTGSPTASQASQRKAGPACFVILPPAGTTSTPATPAQPVPGSPPTTGAPPAGGPPFLPDTAMMPVDDVGALLGAGTLLVIGAGIFRRHALTRSAALPG